MNITITAEDKDKLFRFAEAKAKGASSVRDISAAHGYIQAICHAKIITGNMMHELQDLAEKSYQERLEEKRAARPNP